MARVRILQGVQISHKFTIRIITVQHKINKFNYEKTLKSKPSDTFFNFQILFYITAPQITKALYYTKVTPHQVILISLITGIVSSILMIQNNLPIAITGSLMLFYKNVLDKVDGSLARAKGITSRRGRFYDSITDFAVNIAVFTAIAYKLYSIHPDYLIFIISFAGMLSLMLQTSYFIFYQITFIKYTGKQIINRTDERVTEEDLINTDKFTLMLQRIFNIIYGWQDRIFIALDKLLLRTFSGKYDNSILEGLWYKDKIFLTMISILPIGTHLFVIAYAAVINNFMGYLILNLIFMNLLLILSIVYHLISVKIKIKRIGINN